MCSASGMSKDSEYPVIAMLKEIQTTRPNFEWVGIYILRGDTLELGPYLGAATEHTKILVGQGVCGTAVAQGKNMLVEDVRLLDNYIACSASVRSEIVVLIWHEGEIVGQIDADCDAVGGFNSEDETYLTQVAEQIAPVVVQWAAEGWQE